MLKTWKLIEDISNHIKTRESHSMILLNHYFYTNTEHIKNLNNIKNNLRQKIVLRIEIYKHVI